MFIYLAYSSVKSSLCCRYVVLFKFLSAIQSIRYCKTCECTTRPSLLSCSECSVYLSICISMLQRVRSLVEAGAIFPSLRRRPPNPLPVPGSFSRKKCDWALIRSSDQHYILKYRKWIEFGTTLHFYKLQVARSVHFIKFFF